MSTEPSDQIAQSKKSIAIESISKHSGGDKYKQVQQRLAKFPQMPVSTTESLDDKISSYLLDKPDNAKAVSKKVGSGLAEKAKAAKFSEAAASLAGFGLLNNAPLSDQHEERDELDFQAIHILDLLRDGVFNFVELTKTEKNVLFRYFFRTNPILGRIIDLHTDIPLSKIRVLPPVNAPEILKDYIMRFFEPVLKKLDFSSFIRDFVLSYWIYGKAIAQVDDYFADQKKVLTDVGETPSPLKVDTSENLVFCLNAETQYQKNPEAVSVEDRLKYLKIKLKSHFVPEYLGPDTLRVLGFWEIKNSYNNYDTKYEAHEIYLSPSFLEARRSVGEEPSKILSSLGYSKGLTYLIQEALSRSDSLGASYSIDNNALSGYPYVFSMKRPDSLSIINRVIYDLIAWEATRKAILLRIDSTGKVGRVITAPELSGPQIDGLKAEVEMMLQDPDYAIVVNYEVRWEEVMKNFKDELRDIIDSGQPLVESLSTGLGMPQSMIGGEAMYSGQTVQLDIVNTQYRNLKEQIKSSIEEGLFRQISLRKGFIVTDSWGSDTVLYPRLSFSRVDMRVDSYLDLFNQLYLKGSLPVEQLYELLNLEPEEMLRGLQKNIATPLDPTFNDILRDVYQMSASDIYSQTDVLDRIVKATGFTKNLQGPATPMGEG